MVQETIPYEGELVSCSDLIIGSFSPIEQSRSCAGVLRGLQSIAIAGILATIPMPVMQAQNAVGFAPNGVLLTNQFEINRVAVCFRQGPHRSFDRGTFVFVPIIIVAHGVLSHRRKWLVDAGRHGQWLDLVSRPYGRSGICAIARLGVFEQFRCVVALILRIRSVDTS
jgi:hypothetical protein